MNTTEELFIVWQDSKSSKYFPVGHLEYLIDGDLGYYKFNYTKGTEEAKEYGFEPFLAFPSFPDTYCSKELFSFFKNRILPRSRNEYASFVEHLRLSPDDASPIEILGRSGGRRATDSVELFIPPKSNEIVQGQECLIGYFFLVHGLRHMRECAQHLADDLKQGDQLFIMHDYQNPVDQEALVLRTEDYCCVGFLPRYLLHDCWKLVRQEKAIKVIIEKLNPPPAPVQQRILCKMETTRPKDFKPCSSRDYQPFSMKLETTS